MHYGFVLPGGRIETMPELAYEAEQAGWDGVFIPDCICIDHESITDPAIFGADPWVLLTAMAMRTERIRIGPMVTPVSRRRPWKLARETMTLDHLSHGRLILPVGLGALDDAGFGRVGEATERKVRAHLLDEGLAILAGLWSGQPFSYEGAHYRVDNLAFLPTPVQQPRIPIWVVAAWPRERSMRRALQWDGILPNKMNADNSQESMTPADVLEMKRYISERRTQTTPFDTVVEGETPGDNPAQAREQLLPYAEAGVTWWLESMWSERAGYEGPGGVLKRIQQGPPMV
jgi:alkanesulfonate monooxygenase SsuD/methylene tetrahydromethanopterin reductase-like flavin-dependent oxidoreductase (luciferase family)